GIRDDLVTGVQTCALPICLGGWGGRGRRELEDLLAAVALQGDAVPVDRRDARPAHLLADAVELLAVRRRVLDHGAGLAALQADEIGRASCRERGGVSAGGD